MIKIKILKIGTVLMLGLAVAGVWGWKRGWIGEALAASSLVKTTQADFGAGKYEFGDIDVGSTNGQIKLQQNFGAWDVGSTGDPLDMGLYNYPDLAMVKVGRFAYTLRNRMTGILMRYDLDSREWREMSPVPNAVYEIADMTTNGIDTIYAFATRYSAGPPALTYKHFLKYDIATDTWSYLAEPPGELRVGASLEYVAGTPNYIYAIQGTNSYGFWKYDVAANSWSTISNSTYYVQYEGYGDLLYDGSTYLYAATGWQAPDRLYRFDIGTTTWSYFNLPANGSVREASNMALLNNQIFIARGAGTTAVYKFDIGTTTFSTLGGMPGGTTYSAWVAIPEESRILVNGGITGYWYYYPDSNTWSQTSGGAPSYATDVGQNFVADGSGNLYWCRGVTTSTCFKYAIGVGWTQIANTPDTLRTGASLVYAGGYLYAFRGDIANTMYVYNPATNSWTTGTAPPGYFSTGSAETVVIGAGVTEIYALRGVGTATMYKYAVGGTWSTSVALPEVIANGAGLVGVGSTLFALQGNMKGNFYKLSIGETAWTRVNALPVGSYFGGSMTTDGVDTIYATVGGNNNIYARRFYKYTISTNTWTRINDTPEQMNNGGAIVWSGGSVYVLQGNYGYGFWKYTPAAEASDYVTSGTWYSPVYDLSSVASWGDFASTVTGVGVSFYSRTSALGNLWSDWVLINSNTIVSAANRYIQIKVQMTGDGTATPIVSDFTINYNADSTAPTVSGIGVSGYSVNGGSSLTPGQSYDYQNPYFSWTAATDSGAGVDGYYVYFGVNASGDPATLGNYQYTTNYTVGTTMGVGTTHYLRIKAKDKAGNTSEAVTGFSYVYSGISSVSTKTITTQGNFEDGELASVEASSSAWWNTKFLYRKQITVSNVGTTAVYKDDIVSVDVGTSALLAAGKIQSDGDDLRVVYWDGVDWLEARRGWENLNTDDTTVYFEAQAKIDPSGSDNSYYLYYGNSTAIGPTPMSIVHDNFNDNVINSDLWTTNPGYGVVSEASSQIGYSGRVTGNNGASSQFRSNVGVTGDFVFEANILPVNNSGASFYGGVFLGSYDDATVTDAAGVGVFFHYNGNVYTYSKAAGGSYVNLNLTKTYTKGQWYTVKVIRMGSSWFFYLNGEVVGSYPNLYSGDVYVSSMRYWKESIITSSQGDLYFDDIYFNSKVATGVSASLGSEIGVSTSTSAALKLIHEKNGTWAGYQMPSLPREMRSQYSPGVVAGNYLYILRGYGSMTFYRQDLTTGVGATLPDAPVAINTTTYFSGATMVYDGSNTIYITQGGYSTGFYKYTISSGEWSNSISQPGLRFYYGSAGVRVGTVIYYFRGEASTDFLKYDILADSWSNMASSSWTQSYGSGLAYDGVDTIWAIFGANVSFAKYTVSTNTWSVGSLPQVPYYVGGGASNNLAYDSVNGDLYTFTYYNSGLSDSKRRYVWKFNIASNKWSSVDVASEITSYVGSVVYDGSRYVYLIQGYNGSDSGVRGIYRFDLVTKKYLPETPSLPLDKDLTSGDTGFYFFNPLLATSLVSDQVDSVYYFQGSSSRFSRYKISEKRWYMEPPIPCTYGGGGAAVEGGYVYVACSGTTKYFFRFNPNTEEWEQLADTTETITVNGGQGLAGDGNGNLYLVRGVGTTTMYKYTTGTGTWSVESNSLPATIGASNGTSLVYDGSGALYLIRGNNTSNFYKYTIASQTWEVLPSVPLFVYYSSGSIYNDGKIYTIAGDQTKNFYIYDTVNKVWERGPDLLSQSYGGSAMTKGPGNTAYAVDGWYDWGFWKFNLPSATTSYKYRGTFNSTTYDLGNPYRWAGLSAAVSSPSATAVTFETRTSGDGASWSGWSEATALKNISSGTFTYNIGSTVSRYLQLKTTLDSEESMSTPVVSNIKIDYYNDNIAPTNPSTLVAHNSNVGVTDLTTNTWYNYSVPLFMWPGATDGIGSGIAGYYVYFGGDTATDPSSLVALQVGTTYAASLSTDGDYYLRIQTRDNAGNISEPWEAFHYRYDGTAPIAPSSVAADPRTYTAVNSFTLFWTAVGDTAGGGLLGYKYKIGEGGTEVSTTQSQVTGVTAYQNGANTFYVKAVDSANNSSEYTATTFYYNGSAPSPPTNLSVGVSYNTENSFSFSWDLPASYSGSVAGYRYSVNALPTANNYSSTTVGVLPSGAYATLKGKNVLYVVAVDEAGNVNYDAYASVEFTADTSAPGVPTGIETFDNSIRASKLYKVGLSWNAPVDLGTGFAGYAIYGSGDTNASCTTDFSKFTLAGTTAGTTYVVSDIGGTALSSKTYYFCIKAYDSTNQYSAISSTVSLLPTGKWLSAPGLSTNPASSVKTKSATITWATDREANSFVKYGTSPGSYGNEVGSSDQVTSHSVKLTGLNPGVKYYYKVIWTDGDGNEGSSSEANFTTNSAPTVSTVTTSDVGLYSAYVKFTVKNASQATLQYGKTTVYGSSQSITTSTTETTYTVKLENLDEGTVYHFRIVAKDEEGNEFTGDDYYFETLPIPKIEGVKIQQVKGMPTATLRLAWQSNTEISSIVSYYPLGLTEMSLDAVSLTLTTDHEMLIKNLRDNTDYVFVVKGKDKVGNSAENSTINVKTSVDIRSPLIMNLKVESTVTGVGEGTKAQIIVSWDTDEPAASQVEYGEGTGVEYANKTQEDTNLTLNHMVTIPDLVPNKVYHLRVVSKDRVGNATQSYDNVVITPKATRAALDLVVDSLSKSFSVFSQLSKMGR